MFKDGNEWHKGSNFVPENETNWKRNIPVWELEEDVKEENNVEENFVEEDLVNSPSHYTWLKDVCGIEPIDIARHLDFDDGNIIKYVLRAGLKKEKGLSHLEKQLQDYQKAKWYIEDKIKMIEKEIKQENN